MHISEGCKTMHIEDWTERFEGTRRLPAPVRARLRAIAKSHSFPAGTEIFSPHNIPESLVFLYDGQIRVSQSSDTGREIVLYRVTAGESCVLTTACMLAEEAYNAEGIAETGVTIIALPKIAFDQLLAEEEAFRKFVFAAYARRMVDLLRVVDDVAFGRIDLRLAERLLALAGGADEVRTTHQDLAKELGTAREVISRVLHDFQKRNLISQSRGCIRLIDKDQLNSLAHSH